MPDLLKGSDNEKQEVSTVIRYPLSKKIDLLISWIFNHQSYPCLHRLPALHPHAFLSAGVL